MNLIEAEAHDIPLVKQLFREYQQWLGVDLCFQGFEAELAELPGCYAAPRGSILLAVRNKETIGCVAVRPNVWPEAELKRLFVKPDYQGQGAGKMLFTAAMEKATAIGYTSIVLDTLPSMKTAQAMYRHYGFSEIEPYCENPLDGVKYFRYQFAGISS